MHSTFMMSTIAGPSLVGSSTMVGHSTMADNITTMVDPIP
jgi:hypothetical protein